MSEEKYLKVIEGRVIGTYEADGALLAAGCCKLTGNNKLAEQDDGTARSHCFNTKSAADGDLCSGSFGHGNIVETNNYSGTPVAGNVLIWDHTAKTFKVDTGFEVGEVMSVEDGVMIFKSLI